MSKTRSHTNERSPSHHATNVSNATAPARTDFTFAPRAGTAGASRRSNTAWRTGKYYSNSGMQNAVRPR